MIRYSLSFLLSLLLILFRCLVKRELADSICVKHDTISFELIQRSVGEGKIDSVELGTCFQVSGFYCLNFLILFLFATLVTDAHLSFDNKKVYLGIVDKLSNITNSFVNLFSKVGIVN
jgi:hypothetical protein